MYLLSVHVLQGLDDLLVRRLLLVLFYCRRLFCRILSLLGRLRVVLLLLRLLRLRLPVLRLLELLLGLLVFRLLVWLIMRLLVW